MKAAPGWKNMQPQTTPHTQTAPVSQQDSICLRSIQAASLLTIATTLLLFAAHQNAYACGFLIGALLSLLSLISLTVIVPFLFQPNAPRYMSALLLLTLFMKLPLFVVGLYLMTHLRGVAPAAGAIGIGLGPVVIGLKTAGSALLEGLRSALPAVADEPKAVEDVVLTQTAHTMRPRIAELASE